LVLFLSDLNLWIAFQQHLIFSIAFVQTLSARSNHIFFGYNHRRSDLLNRGIAKYVRPMTIILVIIKLKSNGCIPKKDLRINEASELMEYAPINATIAIFHLGGGTIAFNPGRLNHVSKPVAFCKYGVEYLFTSSVCLRKSSELSHASREALSLNL